MVGLPHTDNSNHRVVAEKCREKIESIGLPPAERADLVEVLSSRFAPDRYTPVIHYGRHILGMSNRAVDGLLQEVAFRCLEVGCKGKMLERLVEAHPFLRDAIQSRVMRKYRLNVDDLPPWEDEQECIMYDAPLSQDYRVIRSVEVQRHVELAGGRVSQPPIPALNQHSAQSQSGADMDINEGDHPVNDMTEEVADEQAEDQDDEDDLVSVGCEIALCLGLLTFIRGKSVKIRYLP